MKGLVTTVGVETKWERVMDGRGSESDLIWRSAAANNNKSKIAFMRLSKDHTTNDSQKFQALLYWYTRP